MNKTLRLALLALFIGFCGTSCADDSSVIGVDDGGAAGGDTVEGKLIAKGKTNLATAACTAGPMTCPGATWPSFKAPDFQPQSPLNGSEHGLEAFKGRIIIVAMLAGW